MSVATLPDTDFKVADLSWEQTNRTKELIAAAR